MSITRRWLLVCLVPRVSRSRIAPTCSRPLITRSSVRSASNSLYLYSLSLSLSLTHETGNEAVDWLENTLHVERGRAHLIGRELLKRGFFRAVTNEQEDFHDKPVLYAASTKRCLNASVIWEAAARNPEEVAAELLTKILSIYRTYAETYCAFGVDAMGVGTSSCAVSPSAPCSLTVQCMSERSHHVASIRRVPRGYRRVAASEIARTPERSAALRLLPQHLQHAEPALVHCRPEPDEGLAEHASQVHEEVPVQGTSTAHRTLLPSAFMQDSRDSRSV